MTIAMAENEDFQALILNQLLPEFCNDPKRNYGSDGFRESSMKVADTDAQNFMRAWHAGLVRHLGRGLYRAQCSQASEQFFWQGKQTNCDRTITLWLEPIITVATLARLHVEFAWPGELLGTQSRDWAFDVTAFRSEDLYNECIACEVKKTVGEAIQLIDLMRLYSNRDDVSEDGLSPKEKNAYRKVKGLRARRAPVFWVVGPDQFSRPFKVVYESDGSFELKQANENLLVYGAVASARL